MNLISNYLVLYVVVSNKLGKSDLLILKLNALFFTQNYTFLICFKTVSSNKILQVILKVEIYR